MSVEQILEHQWPNGTSVYLMSIRVRIDELARIHGFSVLILDDDGLGPERGCLLKLPSGRVILLCELEHSIQFLGAVPGPAVQVDAGDAVELGMLRFADEVGATFGLSADQIFLASDDSQAWLAEANKALVGGRAWLSRRADRTNQ